MVGESPKWHGWPMVKFRLSVAAKSISVDVLGIIPWSPARAGYSLTPSWYQESFTFLHNEVHPISLSRNLTNCTNGRGFVRMSAICSCVDMCSIVIRFDATHERKWCNRIDRCFVLGRVWWLVAISIQLLLSLKVLQTTFGVLLWTGNFFPSSSLSKWIIAMTCRNAEDKAIYSDFVVLRAIKVCMDDFHRIGHPA